MTGIATLERPSSAPSISDVCAEIVRTKSLSAVAARAGVKLVRANNELKACCPFHPDKSPSFTIYGGDRRFCCFGCGKQGDVLDFVREAYGVGLLEAIDMLDAGALAALPQPEAGDGGKDWTAAAARIWGASAPIAGTPAEVYLRRRGLTLDLLPTLRFARLRPPKDSGIAEALGATNCRSIPSLVALVTDPVGNGLGVQRTFLTEGGGKAASTDGKVKFSLGRIRGGAIQLGEAADGLIVCEGLEDGLTLAQETARPVWVAAGTSMLPAMRLPEIVRSVVIGADGDAPGETAAAKAGQAFVASGRSVRIMRPTPPWKDFNAELMADQAGFAS